MRIYILGEGKLYCNKCYLSNGLRCDQNKTFSTCRRCPELIDMPFYCYERQYNISATQMISERDCIRKDFYEANWPCFPNLLACKVRLLFLLNTLSTNSTKWSNALKQFLGYWTFCVVGAERVNPFCINYRHYFRVSQIYTKKHKIWLKYFWEILREALFRLCFPNEKNQSSGKRVAQ